MASMSMFLVPTSIILRTTPVRGICHPCSFNASLIPTKARNSSLVSLRVMYFPVSGRDAFSCIVGGMAPFRDASIHIGCGMAPFRELSPRYFGVSQVFFINCLFPSQFFGILFNTCTNVNDLCSCFKKSALISRESLSFKFAKIILYLE